MELLEGDPSKATITLQYDSVADYRSYNQADLFYGTVEEAVRAGYLTEETLLLDAGDGGGIRLGDLGEKVSGRHVLISEEPILFYCPYRVTHYSDGVVLNQDGSADLGACEGRGILLLKK